jgi:hypothetical protein
MKNDWKIADSQSESAIFLQMRSIYKIENPQGGFSSCNSSFFIINSSFKRHMLFGERVKQEIYSQLNI